MSLSSSLPNLKSGITAALDAKVKSAIDGKKPTELIVEFAKSVSKSINDFSLTAVINTTSTIPPGQIDTVSAGKNAAPVIGPGTGGISDLDLPGLEDGIKKSYEKSTAMGTAVKGDKSPKHKSEEVIEELSKNMADAILKYAKTALVTTEVTYPSFVTLGMPGPPPVTPATMLPGEKSDGTGRGGSSLGLTGLDSKVSSLKNNIVSAFKTATDSGSKEGANPGAVNEKLGSDLGQAIYSFFTSSVVKTEDTTRGGTDSGPASGGSLMVNPAAPPPTIPTVPPPKTITGAVGDAVGTVS